jgi:hypothetical protein
MRRFSTAPRRAASTNLLLAARRALLNHPLMRSIVLSLLLAMAGLVGCRGGDRRPWTICYRVYDQCGERIGALTRGQCETTLAQKPPHVLAALIACVRVQPCPGIVRSCPLPPRP